MRGRPSRGVVALPLLQRHSERLRAQIGGEVGAVGAGEQEGEHGADVAAVERPERLRLVRGGREELGVGALHLVHISTTPHGQRV